MSTEVLIFCFLCLLFCLDKGRPNDRWLDLVVQDLARERERRQREQVKRDILHAWQHGQEIWISDVPGWEEEILNQPPGVAPGDRGDPPPPSGGVPRP